MLQGWTEGSAHYEHQRPRWALTWSFEMIGASHSVNKSLGRLCTPLILSAGMEIQLSSDSGPEEGEECKDLKEMGHHFLPGCVCSWWVVDQSPTCCPCSPGAILKEAGALLWAYNMPPEKCFIEQHYSWVTDYSYSNFHVNLHVMLLLSVLKWCSHFWQWPAVV